MCLVCHSSSHNIASKMLLKLPVIVETVSYLPRVPSKKKTKKKAQHGVPTNRNLLPLLLHRSPDLDAGREPKLLPVLFLLSLEGRSHAQCILTVYMYSYIVGLLS